MRKVFLILMAAAVMSSAFALSRQIGRDIEFSKDFDPAKAAAIRKLIQNEQYKFVDGNVSYWPPDWATRLSFTGDTASLNQFIADLQKLPGVAFKLVLYRGRNDELRRDSAWQLDFSKAHPDVLSLYVNANATNLDLQKISFPAWPAGSVNR